MAHFARVDKITKEVLHVHVVDNWNCEDKKTKQESEFIGVEYLKEVHKNQPWINDIVFVQTSYNHSKRGRYAGKGMRYNLNKDEFESKVAQQENESLARKVRDLFFSSSVSVPKIRFGECEKPTLLKFVLRNNFRKTIFFIQLVAYLLLGVLLTKPESLLWYAVSLVLALCLNARFILSERKLLSKL